jgi:hypothetical protein
MSMNRMKEFTINKRMTTMTHVDLVPTDIIPLVNYAWEQSFVKVESNKRAICDHGWYPLNRNLLLEDDTEGLRRRTGSRITPRL